MNVKEINDLRNKCNTEHVLVQLDIEISPGFTDVVYSVRIDNKNVISALVELCLKYGKDFQGLFYTTEAYYKSCFIYAEDCDLNEVINILKNEHSDIAELWEEKRKEIVNILISFPENKKHWSLYKNELESLTIKSRSLELKIALTPTNCKHI